MERDRVWAILGQFIRLLFFGRKFLEDLTPSDAASYAITAETPEWKNL